MFEPRLGHLSWHVVAPSPPDDVTPDLVRQVVAGSPGAVAVELSAAFLHRRPGSDIGEWRRLDQELESEGDRGLFRAGGRGGVGDQGFHLAAPGGGQGHREPP